MTTLTHQGGAGYLPDPVYPEYHVVVARALRCVDLLMTMGDDVDVRRLASAQRFSRDVLTTVMQDSGYTASEDQRAEVTGHLLWAERWCMEKRDALMSVWFETRKDETGKMKMFRKNQNALLPHCFQDK